MSPNSRRNRNKINEIRFEPFWFVTVEGGGAVVGLRSDWLS